MALKSSLRILVSSDNHLGHKEDDPIIGQDTFVALDEILGIAKAEEADLVLLGGDLFDVNAPTRNTLMKSMEILGKFVFGDGRVEFEIVSDQEKNFPSAPGRCVNYENPNVNVAMPIFAIHGNHDDPSGHGNFSAIDLLSSANLLNYFGKCENLEQLEIEPILIEKEDVKVAIYGLGSIRDERLHRIFLHNKIKWIRPAENTEEWTNILVLHQNRTQHSSMYKNCIPESMLPEFFDVVIWGHEHESKIEFQHNPSKDFYVTQPGSSCRTSLCGGEAVDKQIGILEINSSSFKMLSFPLRYQRPFAMDDIDLKFFASEYSKGDSKSLEDFLTTHVEALLARAEMEILPEDIPAQMRLPLIRLRVFYYDGDPVVNVQRFGQKFMGRVANPDSLLLTSRRRKPKSKKSKEADAENFQNDLVNIDAPVNEGAIIEDLVYEFLEVTFSSNRSL